MKKLLFLTIAISYIEVSAQIITTIVGNGIQGFSGDGGLAINAKLNGPTSIATDKAGNIYFSDLYNDRIRKVDTSGVITTVAGGGNCGSSNCGDGGLATSALLSYPYGIAIDESGNLYIADLSGSRIRKVDTNGIINTIAGNGSQGFSGDGGPATNAMLKNPTGVAIDLQGNILITDQDNYRIRKVDTNGIINTIAGDGISIYSGDGGLAINAQFTMPSSITIDMLGNIFITDHSGNRIRKIDTNGMINTVVGNGLQGFSGDGGLAINAEINLPYGIAIDTLGVLYLPDQANHRIRKVSTSGIINTIAGNGIAGYSGDGGLAINAQLYYPLGAAINPVTGDIYICDINNDVIRKISANNVTKINLIEPKTVTISPNPTSDILNIELPTQNNNTQIEIENTLGQKVHETKTNSNLNTINIKSLESGIYLIKVYTAGQLIGIEKFIKD